MWVKGSIIVCIIPVYVAYGFEIRLWNNFSVLSFQFEPLEQPFLLKVSVDWAPLTVHSTNITNLYIARQRLKVVMAFSFTDSEDSELEK